MGGTARARPARWAAAAARREGWEHLRASRDPFPVSDWEERHREWLATRGGLRDRAWRPASLGERRRVRRSVRRAMACGSGRGTAFTKMKNTVGAHRREGSGVGGVEGVTARRSLRWGGAAPRGHGRGGREERWRPELLVTRPRTHRFLRCSTTDGDD
uniref:Uncharacterized protein n=1 Tax=Oryza sativa subsp. japonica TaxID=39947 RepID=Q6ZAR8_ORYSJ|nr:hypothetical protein [Oryza sativa Japonica Group]BAD03315.1 hypothetical protein [Oryza sativa Japonica Group]